MISKGILSKMMVAGWVCFVVAASAGEFKPDANTLFLAHYNTSLNADYSQGPAKPDPLDTAYLTKNGGCFGGGLVARVGAEALKEAGADVSASTLMPIKFFDGVRYPSPGNLDLVKGTFECRYKPYFSIKRAEKMPEGWPIHYTIFGYTETNESYMGLGINHYVGGNSFYSIVSKKEGGLVCINSGITWNPGTWHHVAMTWDTTEVPGSIALFLDGRLAQKLSLAPLKGGFLKQTNEFPYFSIGAPLWRKSGNEFQFYKADGVIDEVRISNIVRYKEDFVPEEKSRPSTAGK